MNRAVKVVLLLAVVAAVVVLLFTVVFPWVDGLLADPTLGLTRESPAPARAILDCAGCGGGEATAMAMLTSVAGSPAGR